MNQDRDNDHFDKMTDFLTQEARRHVLDAIACEFHNQGYTLNGNTEASDVAWLARRIGDRIDYLALSNDDLLKVAEVARHAMSELADRMASRYIAVSQAVRTIERIERQQARRVDLDTS